MKTCALSAVLVFLILPPAIPFQLSGAERSSPNVLLILTDDQGYGDVSLYGNPHLRTPAMDRIAREGVRLDRFYVNPTCSPTRAALLTGRFHLRSDIFGMSRREEVLRPEEVTVAELFQGNGYATGLFGKWHVGSVYPETPNGQGFDEFFGILGGVSQLYFNPILNHNGVEGEYRGYITEILTDKAIDWMETQIEADQPFFSFVSYNAPHTPGLVEDEYWEPFYEDQVGRWEAVIWGMVQVIDEQVARLLHFLEEKGLAENTIVIFMSDNGPATFRYNAGLRGKKSSVYDGGTRVPCFIRWPEQLKPNRIAYPLAHVDLLPTLADWCGLDGIDGLDLDGRSFSALAENPDLPWEDRMHITFAHRNPEHIRSTGAVHTNRWAAVMQRGKWELYDMAADVRQLDDVAEEHPEVVRELGAHFNNVLATMPPLGTPTPFPLRDNGVDRVVMHGHDAQLPPEYKGKGIDYNFGGGINGTWVSSWTDPDAVPEWNLDVIDGGTFEVSLAYCLPERDLGVQAFLEVQGKRLPVNITEAFDPPPNPQPFLLDGEASKYENKDWKVISLGEVSLEKGKDPLRIHVTEIPGEAAMEVKAVVLRRL
jgi:arylsulfatase A-like enzyme